VGALVLYGLGGFRTGQARWRVNGWLRVAPPEDLKAVDPILAEVLAGVATSDDGRPRYQWCLPEEATHVSLSGICGAIAPIGECRVTGRVGWPRATIEAYADRAREVGRARMRAF
jgi:hypothetical protein